MSEYQCYEFVALDRPLTSKQDPFDSSFVRGAICECADAHHHPSGLGSVTASVQDAGLRPSGVEPFLRSYCWCAGAHNDASGLGSVTALAAPRSSSEAPRPCRYGSRVMPERPGSIRVRTRRRYGINGYFEEAIRPKGEVAFASLGPFPAIFVSRPDLIRHVLVTHKDVYLKDKPMRCSATGHRAPTTCRGCRMHGPSSRSRCGSIRRCRSCPASRRPTT